MDEEIPARRQADVPVLLVALAVGIPIASYSMYRTLESASFALAALVLATSGASFFPVRLPTHRSPKSSVVVTVSDVFVFAGILVISPGAATCLAIVDCLFANKRARNKLRILLSVCIVSSVTYASGRLFYKLLGASPPVEWNNATDLNRFTLAFLLTAVFYFTAHSGLAAAAAARALGLSWIRVWRREFFWSSLTNFTGVISIGAVFLTFKGGAAYSVLVLVPIPLIMYYSYRINSHRIQSLRKSQQFLQDTLDSMSAAVAILDASGSILAVNKVWSEAEGDRLFGEQHQTGSDYIEKCGSVSSPWKNAGMRVRQSINEVLAGKDSARFEYCSSEQTDPSWYSASITRFFDEEQTRVVVTHEDVTQLRQAEKRIIHLAYYDELTRLPNRYFMNEHLRYLIQHAKRHRQIVAILAIDLDDVARLNTSLGYRAGDQLLCAVANRLKVCLRRSDCLARDITAEESLIANGYVDTLVRFEGDEFFLVLSDISSYQDAETVATRIQRQFEDPFVLEGVETFASASIGISLFPEDAIEMNRLVEAAEAALHYVKKNAKRSYGFYSEEISLLSTQRLSVEARLRHAIDHQKFELHYQPRINLVTGGVQAVEALVRLSDGSDEKTPPSEFIPVAEETGLILPMTAWILETACRQCRAWQSELLYSLKVSVNISARHFHGGKLLEAVSTAIQASGLAPSDLELEITEGVLLDDFEGCAQVLSELKDFGVGIALDDFGTGYSSLSYLSRLPIDTIKIDRSFLIELPTDPKNRSLVTAIIAVAKSLQLRIVAEGIEHEEQLLLLRELGCNEVQGFYFSPPVEAAQFPSLVDQFSNRPHQIRQRQDVGPRREVP